MCADAAGGPGTVPCVDAMLVVGLEMLTAGPEVIVVLSFAVREEELVLGFFFLLPCSMP